MAMFPQFGAVPAAAAGSEPAPLLSFKAGKMVATQTDLENFHISPDLRKGTISVFRSPEDQLLHFTWKVRPSGEVEDDLIPMPQEAVYKRVDTGREGDRVFLMEIVGVRSFFWMQDKSPDKDEENMKKVNELINSPQDSAPGGGAGGSTDMLEIIRNMQQPGVGGIAGSLGSSIPSASAGTGDQGLNIQNLQSILQNMGFSPDDQAPSDGGRGASAGAATSAASSGGGSTTTTTTAAAATAASPTNPAGGDSGGRRGLTSADLQRAMMNLSGMASRVREPPISLNDVVNADAIEDTGILDDPEVQNALIPLLAPGQQNQAELRDIVSGTTAAVLVRGQCFFG